MTGQSSAGRIEQWQGFIFSSISTSPGCNFFPHWTILALVILFPSPENQQRHFNKWIMRNRHQMILNLSGKGGKQGVVWGSLLYCSSIFQPQALVSVLPPTASPVGCVTPARDSSIQEGELAPHATAPNSAEAPCKQRQDSLHFIASSLARGCRDVSGQLSSCVGITRRMC